ncbi:histidinol-phosphate transaminase [Solemya pervernicosa gill symbiont]|uniref:Histidinol-phosphate aminotransferase n=2 Tax=Gammaproteobacteria incertae sedis TaxID=118884 RepID=A0A1T2L3N9_9GAMM|nr:histidinol-phosphate transaminase [Candidatus Reidiella endopervernicosa]OOZ39728.1 histidinol-phosphate transaminase [Solemya pervernicosa gill symbiont]QKQ26653.1 histidinol-phosphate transaminase [Candidatus Reidiella endopervernicosa]
MTDFTQFATPGVQGLRPYQPGKPIEELERELGIENIIKLASNENPLGPSPLALEAMRSAAEGVWLYPDGNGFELKQKLSQKHGVEMAQITLGNGSSDPLEFVVRVLVQPGDEVLYSQHAFAMYPIVTRAAGGVGIEAPAKNWGYDLDALAARITDRTRVIFIANPNNPTGTWLDGVELEAFIKSVPERIVVVIDEAYYDYACDPATGAEGYPDAVSWLAKYPNLMVSRTFSKSYALAGLRVGYALSSPELADLMNRVRPPFNVNNLALVAASAALDDKAHLQRSVAMNAEGLKQLRGEFEAMGLDYIPSVGNFISVDVGQPGMKVYEELLREGVIVRPVANYGMPNHLRVTVGRAEENTRFIEGLKRTLAST